ncbi:hypothetical protein HAX54_005205 [Datura stramonium]|uniref:Uncharacterized protein n=1 Tax=Datura stramonium TaxID=4076 RepID=A0ABS8T9I0_DATST|nr:hypothetical protein [Datura stramonium]
MSLYHRYLFDFVIKNLILHQEQRDAASYLDLTLMELLDREMPIDFSKLIIAYLTKVVTNVQQNHALPYDFLLTKVFGKLGVRFTSLEYSSFYDALDYFEIRGSHPDGYTGESADGAGTSQSQEFGELVKNEETVVARHNDLMSLIWNLSPSTMSSPSIDTPFPPIVPWKLVGEWFQESSTSLSDKDKSSDSAQPENYLITSRKKTPSPT